MNIRYNSDNDVIYIDDVASELKVWDVSVCLDGNRVQGCVEADTDLNFVLITPEYGKNYYLEVGDFEACIPKVKRGKVEVKIEGESSE